MANMTIDEAIEVFRSAAYGEDVREGLISVAEAVKEAIDNQLITVDDTLTQSGQGADAKKTGDEIADLKSAVEQCGLGGQIKNILLLITAVLRNAIYASDMSSVITQIESLINDEGGGDDPTQEVVITQSGTVLTLSNVASITNVSQSGTILTLS